MKRAIVFFAVLFLSGCMGRSYVTDQSKLDFDTSTGERKAPSNNNDKRKVFVWEIELGKDKGAPKSYKAPSEATTEPSYAPAESTQNTVVTTPEPTMETATTPAVTATTSGDKTYTEYTVQKNDTLQKISQKVYGTTKKWQILYNENKDVLKGPDKVYPGLVIKVPNKQ